MEDSSHRSNNYHRSKYIPINDRLKKEGFCRSGLRENGIGLGLISYFHAFYSYNVLPNIILGGLVKSNPVKISDTWKFLDTNGKIPQASNTLQDRTWSLHILFTRKFTPSFTLTARICQHKRRVRVI